MDMDALNGLRELPAAVTMTPHNIVALNNFGVIVGASTDTNADEHASIYDPSRGWRFFNGLIGSDASSYDVDSASSINNRGQIVGQ